MKIYLNNEKYVAGMTLKDEGAPEQNNTALHVAKDPEGVLENRAKVAQFLEMRLDDFVCANQTHSANFYKVTQADKGRGALTQTTAIPNTDALYTFETGIVLTSFSADCVPVMFYHKARGVVGVIHSGWQGTVKEITLHLFRHLVDKEKCEPSGFFVYIGSALSQEKFEVDADVYEKFLHLGYAEEFMFYRTETEKYHIDNQQTVRKQCELAGIPRGQIFVDETCTFMSAEGFSYREEREAGRHMSFIMRK